MAGASMNGIKTRIKSVKSTMQITKAMELVATSKLRRAKERAESSSAYHRLLLEAISDVEASSNAISSPWSDKRETKKTLYIVIAGDRGLAGGFNSSIFKMTEALAKDGEALFVPIGKKALDYFTHRNRNVFESISEASELGVGGAMRLGARVASAFVGKEIDRVVLVYTKFVSMLTQLPVYEELLPLKKEENTPSGDPIYDSDSEELLSRIVPEYVGGVIYSAICQSVAAECAARRSAMSSANKNAEEMIDSLMLKYNRARQAVITQEITEIVSGADAL